MGIRQLVRLQMVVVVVVGGGGARASRQKLSRQGSVLAGEMWGGPYLGRGDLFGVG